MRPLMQPLLRNKMVKSSLIQDEGQLAPYEFAFSPTLSQDDDTHAFDMKDIQFLDGFSHLV